MTQTEQQTQNPVRESKLSIKDGLGAFRRVFESTLADLRVAVSSDAVQVVFSTAAVVGMVRLLLCIPF